MKVKNHIDDFHYLFLYIYYIICLALSCVILLLHVNKFFCIFSGIIIILNTIMLYFYFGKNYEFTDKYLVIRYGLFKRKINYADIKKCYVTKNSKISYATSFKRVAIKLKNKVIYISPRNIDEVLLTIINKKVKA